MQASAVVSLPRIMDSSGARTRTHRGRRGRLVGFDGDALGDRLPEPFMLPVRLAGGIAENLASAPGNGAIVRSPPCWKPSFVRLRNRGGSDSGRMQGHGGTAGARPALCSRPSRDAGEGANPAAHQRRIRRMTCRLKDRLVVRDRGVRSTLCRRTERARACSRLSRVSRHTCSVDRSR